MEIGSPAIQVLSIVSADTEYSAALPANTYKFSFRSRVGYDLRFAFVTGKVATPTDPYFTLAAGDYFNSPENISVAVPAGAAALTIYFAGDNAGDVVEILTWAKP